MTGAEPSEFYKAFTAKQNERQREHDISEAKRQRLNDWILAATRFLVLSNAGGAVATLAFIGTFSGIYGRTSLAAPSICLFFFVLGVLCTGIVILGQLRKAWLEELEPHRPPTRTDRFGNWWQSLIEKGRNHHDSLLGASFLSFMVGSFLGLLWLVL